MHKRHLDCGNLRVSLSAPNDGVYPILTGDRQLAHSHFAPGDGVYPIVIEALAQLMVRYVSEDDC